MSNILDEHAQNALGDFDIIVSNPPYIPLSDRASLPANVVNFEPAVALFVDTDPLLFYKAIIHLAQNKLAGKGSLYVEVHEEHGREVFRLIQNAGFIQCESRKDMQGKERMVKGSRQ